MESPNKCRVNSGFTLVELSIVMIIIGLLIGGIFGGMKLVENANIQKTIQDLKSFDSAGITFKDIYRALPGDLRNASTRLPNCTTNPCARSGNGDRILGTLNAAENNALTVGDERFVFWHHLSAAGLITPLNNVDDLAFGEGQPDSSLNGGYRILGTQSGDFYVAGNTVPNKTLVRLSNEPSADLTTGVNLQNHSLTCAQVRAVDQKIDNDMPLSGRVLGWGNCPTAPVSVNSTYGNSTSGISFITYVLAF